MRWVTTTTFLGVIVVGLLLRLWIFPSPHLLRDVDERGYLHGGPLVLEGLPPGYQAAPAGPLTWTAWAYTGAKSAMNVLRPGPEEKAVPFTVRPFVAVDHASFDIYRDISGLHRFVVVVFFVVAMLGIAAAFGVGYRYGKCAGGLLVGGLAAVLPMFVDHAVRSRPYAHAWSFAFIAMYFAAAWKGRRAWFWASVCFGLAVASRIDTVVLLPLVYWFLWDTQTRRRPAPLLAITVVSAGITLLVAPWWMTGLIGNLRAIATIQFLGAPSGTDSPRQTLKAIAWTQGLVVILLLLATTPGLARGIFSYRAGRRAKTVLAIYLALLFASVFKSTGFGLHHKAAVLVGLIAVSGLAIGAIGLHAPRLALWVAGAALILPSVQTIRQGREILDQDVPDQSVEWVNAHLRPGSRLYLTGSSIATADPLPTSDCSLAIWNETTEESGARRKFESGLKRIASEPTIAAPRALGELNLVQERGNRRCWYILGGRPSMPLPRFDIVLVNSSPVFGVRDLQAAVVEHPALIIWREAAEGPAPSWLGDPIAKWTSRSGKVATLIFCPPTAWGDLINP